MCAERLEIDPKRTAVFLWAVVLFLVMASCGGLLSKYYLGHGSLRGLIPLFDLNAERNIPTLFSTILILLCSILLSIISIIRIRRHQIAYMWIFLAVIFLFLAVDEFSSLHERLNVPARELLGVSGPFYYAWVIPYGLFLVVLAIIFGRFVFEIPARPRRFMLISAFVYISGAIGCEMVGSWYFDLHNKQKDLIYELITTLEESLEMIGLVTFVYALMIYIGSVQNGIAIQISRTRTEFAPSSRSSQRTGENAGRAA